MQMLSPLAEAGEPEAQFRVAIAHQMNRGVANPDGDGVMPVRVMAVVTRTTRSGHSYCLYGGEIDH